MKQSLNLKLFFIRVSKYFAVLNTFFYCVSKFKKCKLSIFLIIGLNDEIIKILYLRTVLFDKFFICLLKQHLPTNV